MKLWKRYINEPANLWWHSVLRTAVVLLLLPIASVLAQGNFWTTKTSKPSPGSGTASGVVDGKIYAIGGIFSGVGQSIVEEYNPVTDSWETNKTHMPTARFASASCVLDGKIYVFGGQDEAFGASLTAVQMYDPATDTWDTTLTDLPGSRSQATASVVDGEIYIIGGQGGPGNPSLFSIVEYDPAADTYDSTRAGIPTPRVSASASVVEGKIYIIGGSPSGAGGNGLDTVEMYEPATDTWDTTLTAMPTPRASLSTRVVNGIIYAIGGLSEFSPNASFLGEVEAYNPATDAWDTLTGMPTPRHGFASGVVGGRIYAIGGDTEGFTPTLVTEEYTPPSPMTSGNNNISNEAVTFILHQNYPNPFNPATTITFHLPKAAFVNLSIYNAAGQLVQELLNEHRRPGVHSVHWSAGQLSSGIYLYRIQAGDYSASRKALLIK